MNRLVTWLKGRLSEAVAFMVGVLVVESIVMMAGQPHAVKPKGRLGRFCYISETARVPMILSIMILLGSFAVVDASLGKVRLWYEWLRERGTSP